ncbi:MAG: extracellular solute-binding protein [Chelatococcus sp.]|uniref:extracellular solute-binding protein n=1 Tax=unclassified Chelatococcus TaxID=2638111 RepID=UPI001BCBA78E|nr:MULTISPECIES: extracellular solute-binding protein [unclassified Chelatococcus]CAH1652450.1 putative spermidine/putrescine transport system substrate-binding protein [Hyphomicrobiales bacterium]MBS7739986.1 extracellular solute-binding protein [Chelatococcus sp. HY11]MBX3539457.1 extracellular solute-binding protein [Chelatococcus sp.]MBX3547005.1 extracellular solute-binding protein [Chelatococcus sp.]MCO5078714.1 extracellular solute-binding protein [Chelatococcus sp.]
MLDRRSLLKLTAAGAIAAAALVPASAGAAEPPKPAKLTMNVYAGPFEANMRKAVIAPFEADTGIKVELVPSAPPLAKLQAQGASPELDILIAGIVENLIAGQQGLIVKLDPDNIPELKDIYDIAKTPDGVAVNFSALGLAYDKRQWPTPPTSWFDLASDKTPGKIVVRQPDAQNTVAWMAIMAKELNGAWPEKPEDYKKVGELLTKNLKSRLAAITTNTATTRAGFTNAGAGLAVWTDSQVAAFAEESKLPLAFVIPKEGGVMIATTAMVTRTPNKYWAEKLIGYMLRPEAQKIFALNGYYAPSNKTVVVPDDVAAKMVYGQAKIDTLLRMPWDKITPINQQISETFYEAVN